jgi:tRNA (guanine37-N1)-methyltransferase
MQFEIITIFPEFFAGPLDYGIVRRAREARIADVRVHDLRAFAHDRHRTVDDRPFGGGEGMVLKPEPLFEAVESLLGKEVAPAASCVAGVEIDSRRANPNDALSVSGAAADTVGARHAVPLQRGATPIISSGTAIVLLSASGKLFRQETARRFAHLDRIIFICGRYEGVDERVTEHLVTDELSIGDYVLSGGELGAALILDAVTRLLPGALGNEDSTINESFSAVEAPMIDAGVSTSRQSPVASHSPFASPAASPTTRHLMLDYPHYTRPADFRGWPVPEVLLGGNHEEIRKWRQKQALEKTRRNRPDLLARNAIT